MSIPPDDRGFTLGDGLFETVLARDGAPILWERHMARLERGCDVLGLPPPSAEACRTAAVRALTEAGLDAARAAVRLTWSAGSGGRGLDRPEAPVPRLAIQASPAPRVEAPLRLAIVAVRRNEASPASRLKTLSYLDQVLARRAARAAGADEALMLNTRGELACCAAANLFWLQGRAVFTPAPACGVLDGVVRGALIERALAAGLEVHEVRAGPEALETADAVFATNSLIGVREAAAVDGRGFDPHPAVKALAALVEDLA
ncbi:MAG TPA: aminotransferase class IV [Caulobacteraceae bacterium]|jgi:branched-chain amino acid aminotransferase/4-amino-4-deoxychorismate lyase|nr:aminotransferase class IV [Caulobacteraceae bacterium]